MTSTLDMSAVATGGETRGGELIRPFAALTRADVPTVGGKGANLGEMTAAGLPVPPGFVLTIDAYQRFYESNALGERIATELKALDADDPAALEASAKRLRQIILDGRVPDDLCHEIEEAYDHIAPDEAPDPRVAVRSSATAEDTAQFSFAGMFESFLNVSGKPELIDAVKRCWASTFGARVLFYRVKQGLPSEMPVAVIVQRMVSSEKSGVMFTVDPATRDASRMVIEAAWGLGEAIVQGAVTPDRHVLDKASLAVLTSSVATKEFLLSWDAAKHTTARVDLTNDPRANAPVMTPAELNELGTLARRAEEHYGVPQDLEFAIEGDAIYLTQTRPITTLHEAAQSAKPANTGRVLVHGLGASPGRASGEVRVLASPEEDAAMQTGEILVTRMTSPDWVPVMRRAAGIVTDAGGMTSHAAIVARELGLPCIVGAHDATRVLSNGVVVTVDGSAGTVSEGAMSEADAPRVAPATVAEGQPARLVTATKLYVNLGEPARAAEVAARDVDGVGLLRAEFMMLEALEHTHPRAFLASHSPDEFVSRMADGLRTFAQAFAPRPVIYRAMDFRSNEFRNLKGGAEHEPTEANPMIGYRGCFRYTKEPDLFALELRALADVRRDFENLHLMIPFVRTSGELSACLALVDESAVGKDARMERWIMAEVPSVIFRLPDYAKAGITGVSIGSNDLTQLMLGVDRDSELFGAGYDERDEAVLEAIRVIIAQSRRLGLTCSICGQAPSVHAEYAERLVEWGIDSISVNVDAIERTRRNIAVAEQRILLGKARAALDEVSADVAD
ncbi:MAG TPA: phosphoenolpyruvate synthase [Gemmatimonadaceae bacterium]|nr:phosphoenolpyruvate synthase [Gemmatimonadaceae bacterium]